jgi:hypothetical protein
VGAEFLLDIAQGRLQQFTRSGFGRKPLRHWEALRELVARALFPTAG